MPKLISKQLGKELLLFSPITNDNHVCNLNISNVHQSLTNAIRRITLSSIPSVGFDDTYNDDYNRIIYDVSNIANKIGQVEIIKLTSPNFTFLKDNIK